MRPCVHYLPQDSHFADVVGVMIRYQESFTQNCLPRPMRDDAEQISGRVIDERLNRQKVLTKSRQRIFPLQRTGFTARIRPVTDGPIWGNIIGIADKLKDVPLSDTQVLREMPKCVWNMWRFCVDMFHWKIGNHIIEIHMGLTIAQ